MSGKSHESIKRGALMKQKILIAFGAALIFSTSIGIGYATLPDNDGVIEKSEIVSEVNEETKENADKTEKAIEAEADYSEYSDLMVEVKANYA